MAYLRSKKYQILEIFKNAKNTYLEGHTVLSELEKKGITMTKRQLSLFIYNNLEMEYLKASRNQDGTITGWKLIGFI